MIDLYDGLRIIGAKLSISPENMLLIHLYHRDCLGILGKRRLMIVIDNLVERFGLDDRDFERSYGGQLAAQGILTQQEAQLFSKGIYNDGMAEGTQAPAQENTAAPTDDAA